MDFQKVYGQCQCDVPDPKIVGSAVNVPDLTTAISQQILLPVFPALFTTQKFCVQGSFQIDQPYYITTNSEISMDTDALINIENGVFLVISESIISGCQNMWDALHVESGASLAILDSDVWDGKRAVWGDPFSDITLRHSDFWNNYIHVDLLSEQGIGSFQTSIYDNRFGTDLNIPLKPPYAGENSFIGIQMTLATGVTIGNIAQFANTFLRLDYGIFAVTSVFTAANNSYQDLTNPFNPSDLPGTGLKLIHRSYGVVTESDFYWCHIGVSLDYSSLEFKDNTILEKTPTGVFTDGASFQTILIIENDMTVEDHAADLSFVNGGKLDIADNTIFVLEEGSGTATESGIFLTNCNFSINSHAKIRGNDIEMTDGIGIGMTASTWVDILENPSIDLTNSNGNGKGIFLDYSEFCQINRNNISGRDDYALLINQSYGIEPFIFNSHISYCCNSIDDTSFGTYFTGPNGGTDLFATHYNDHNFALVINAPIMMSAIGPQEHTVNRWPGIYPGSNLGAIFTGDFSLIPNSSFEVETLGVPLSPEEDDIDPHPNTGIVWFELEPGTSPTCVTLCPPSDDDDDGGEGFGTIDSLDIRIATAQLTTTTAYDPTAIWMFERYLYSKLELFPNLMQSYPEMASFHSTKQNETVGRFHSVLAGIRNLQNEPEPEIGQYESNNDTVNVRLWELIEIDSSLVYASSSDSVTLLAQRNTILTEIQTLKTENDSLWNLIESHRQTLIQQLIAQNNTIPVSEIYETNEKTVNDIYLNTIAQFNQNFTAQQLTDLANISGQCAYLGGGAVLRARAMYQLTVDTTFNDEVLCQLPPPITNLDDLEKSNSSFEVFPNPASDEIQIRFKDKSYHPVEARITNLNGQTLAVHTLNSSSETYTISTKSLLKGAYFLRISLENGDLLSDKILISR